MIGLFRGGILVGIFALATLVQSPAFAQGPIGNGMAVSSAFVQLFRTRAGVHEYNSHHFGFESESFYRLTGSRSTNGACIFTSTVTMPPGQVTGNRVYIEESIAIDPVRCEKIVARGFAPAPSAKFYLPSDSVSEEYASTSEISGNTIGPSFSEPYWPLPPDGNEWDSFAGLLSMWTDGGNPIFSSFPPQTRPHIVMNSVDTAISAVGSVCQPTLTGVTTGGTWQRLTGWELDPFFPRTVDLDSTCQYSNDVPVGGGYTLKQSMGFVNTTFPTCSGPVNIAYNPDVVFLAFDGSASYSDTSYETGPTQFCTAWHDHFWMIHNFPVIPKKFFLGDPPPP